MYLYNCSKKKQDVRSTISSKLTFELNAASCVRDASISRDIKTSFVRPHAGYTAVRVGGRQHTHSSCRTFQNGFSRTTSERFFGKKEDTGAAAVENSNERGLVYALHHTLGANAGTVWLSCY